MAERATGREGTPAAGGDGGVASRSVMSAEATELVREALGHTLVASAGGATVGAFIASVGRDGGALSEMRDARRRAVEEKRAVLRAAAAQRQEHQALQRAGAVPQAPLDANTREASARAASQGRLSRGGGSRGGRGAGLFAAVAEGKAQPKPAAAGGGGLSLFFGSSSASSASSATGSATAGTQAVEGDVAGRLAAERAGRAIGLGAVRYGGMSLLVATVFTSLDAGFAFWRPVVAARAKSVFPFLPAPAPERRRTATTSMAAGVLTGAAFGWRASRMARGSAVGALVGLAGTAALAASRASSEFLAAQRETVLLLSQQQKQQQQHHSEQGDEGEAAAQPRSAASLREELELADDVVAHATGRRTPQNPQ